MSDTERGMGVPEGEQTYTERLVRTRYPDGTIVDGEPCVVGEGTTPRWALGQLAAAMDRPLLPPGATTRILTRKVTTYATPWVEVAEAEPEVGEPGSSRE